MTLAFTQKHHLFYYLLFENAEIKIIRLSRKDLHKKKQQTTRRELSCCQKFHPQQAAAALLVGERSCRQSAVHTGTFRW